MEHKVFSLSIYYEIKDLNKNAVDILEQNIMDVKQWVIAHQFAGFIFAGVCHFYQPHLYWNLLDDNEQYEVKQMLISDVFREKPSNQTKMLGNVLLKCDTLKPDKAILSNGHRAIQPARMQRKHKFDELSSGSNAQLHLLLQTKD